MKLTARNTSAQHVRLNAGGYTAQGFYWGAGERLYRLDPVSSATYFVDRYNCGADLLHFRAPDARTARELANAAGYTLVTE